MASPNNPNWVQRMSAFLIVTSAVVGSIVTNAPLHAAMGLGLPIASNFSPYAAATSGATTTRVSVTTAGAANTADSLSTVQNMSADARYVVFRTNSSIFPGANGWWQVYRRDRTAGTTTLVSVNTGGTLAGNSNSGVNHNVQITADGRYVLFQSVATDLVAGDTNGHNDSFVRDLTAGTTTMVSLGSGGPANADVSYSQIAAGGGFVVFDTNATNIVGDGVGGSFLRNLTTGATVRISHDPSGLPADGGFSAISANGQYITYASGGAGGAALCCQYNIYRQPAGGGPNTLVSTGPDGAGGNANTFYSVVANDGSVVFETDASNLGVASGLLRSSGGAITQIASGAGSEPWASADGRFVTWWSGHNAYVYDGTLGSTDVVSVSDLGEMPNDTDVGSTVSGSISDDGRYVSFSSIASNIVPGKASPLFTTFDVYLRDRGIVDPAAATPYTFGDDPTGAYTQDGVHLGTGAFTTSASDLGMPGRVLDFKFNRSYNSADNTGGPFGPAWTHSYNWLVADGAAFIDVRRGDGRRDRFTRDPQNLLSYLPPPGIFDVLVKNPDNTYSLTLTNQITYQFGTSGRLTRISEPAGNQIVLAYTGSNLTTITDTVGRAVTLHYDTSNRIDFVQDGLNRKTTYTYDTNGRLSTVTDKIGNGSGPAAAHRWTYAYDGTTPHLTTITDPDARVRITNTYDAQGRVYQQRDALSHLSTVTFDTGSTTTQDFRGNTSTQTYDARKRSLIDTRTVSGQPLTLTHAYFPDGTLASVTDRNGKTTDYTYDTRGNLLTKTAPQVDAQTPRYVTTYTYDAKNNVKSITDPRGFLTTLDYDATTNVVSTVTSQIDGSTNAVTKYEYSDAANKGMVTRLIAPRGNTTGTPNYVYATTNTFDAQGNLGSQMTADGAQTTFAYDAIGRRTSVVDADGNVTGSLTTDHTWTTTYDENDQVKTDVNPMYGTTTYAYDGAGNRSSVTNKNGNATTYTYDANARVATVAQKPDRIGNPGLVYTTTINTRDNNGNPTRITQANNVATDYGYDQLDRLVTTSTHPDAQTTLTTVLTLDGRGSVLTRTTPAPENELLTNTYDPLARLKTVSATSVSTVTYSYDGMSNRTQMVDGAGTTTYQYDGLGRMTQAAAPNGTLGYGYDLDSNRTSIVYPAGSDTVLYTPTNGGRLDHLQDAAGRTSSYTYTPSGLVASLTAPGGLVTAYGYDRAQRLTLVRNAVGTATRSRHAYTLDAEGNRIALDEYVESLTSALTTTWAASVKVNSDTGTTVQDHPAIALGSDGGHFLIWDDARLGNADIEFAWRDPATGTWSTNVKVNSDTGTRVQVNPAIALDGANNAYAVWEDSRDGASNKIDTNIYGAKRTGTTWGTNSRLNTDATGNPVQRNPRVAGTTDGTETAVWVDLRASQINIYSARLPAGATAWPATANLQVTVSNTAALKDFPDVAVGPDGTAYAVWQDNRNGSTNPDIYFSKLGPSASAWSANLKISDDPGTTSQHHPRIGVDASGNVTVVWIDDRTSPSKVRMARLASGSNTWSASTIVTDVAARPIAPLALSVRADGKVYVAFTDNRAGNNDVYATEYDPWLSTWSTTALISDGTGTTVQQGPAVAYSPTEIAAAWRDDRAGNADVRAARATLTGTDHLGMTYDGLERLKSVTGTNPESFVLDSASNISSRTGPAATYAYDTANRLTSDGTRAYSWSPSDRLATRGTDTFTFDALDRMTGSTIAATARTYTYNGDGLMQSRTTSGLTVNFLWDPGAALLVSGGDRVIYGLGPLYTVNGATATTYVRDGLGSIRAQLVSGSLSAAWRYRIYGDVAQFSGAPTPAILGYAGQLLDPSGLYYLRARWYDAPSGRFLNRDPYGGDSTLPASLNAFSYAHLSPASLTDPSGLNPCLGIPWRIGQALCEVVISVGPVLQRIGDKVQRFFQRPVVQEAVEKAEEAASKPAVQQALTKSSDYGQIIGWGTGSGGVDKTTALLESLTAQQVQGMISQGLTKAWVSDQLNKYLNFIDEGGKLVDNAQLGPRLQLMQKILDLWPGD